MQTLLNAIASSVISVSIVGFISMLEAEHNPVSKMHLFVRIWIKTSLALVASGSLLNVLVLSTPHWSEIAMNIGLAGLFTWAYFWHRQQWKTQVVHK